MNETKMSALLKPLAAAFSKKKRQPIPYNLWGKAHVKEVEQAFQARCLLKPVPKKEILSARMTVTRELFAKLPEEIQEEWREKAKVDHAAFQDEWEDIDLSSPAARQR